MQANQTYVEQTILARNSITIAGPNRMHWRKNEISLPSVRGEGLPKYAKP